MTGWVLAAALYLLGGIGLYALACDVSTRWKRWSFVIWPAAIVTQVSGDLYDWCRGTPPNWLKRGRPAGAVDWPPMRSARGLPEGHRQRGSTGQLWQVSNGAWVRLR